MTSKNYCDVYNNKTCILPIPEQEYFMHLIYDIIHIGVSIESMKMHLDDLSIKFSPDILASILNNPMKDEKYSNEKVLPMKKCIYQHKNYQSEEDFFANKLEMIKLLKTYGAEMIDLNANELDMLISMGLIDLEIKNYIVLVLFIIKKLKYSNDCKNS